MGIRIALAGNPSAGKTTLFNALTGSNGYVGNWPGVTVDKVEAKYSKDKDVTITDLPGIYSLSPYSPEEIVTRDYLLEGGPDVVINLVDASNLERNLYLTTQVLDMGVPMVIGLNFMDVVEKNGDKIDVEKLSKKLDCPVVPLSALKGQGEDELVAEAKKVAAEHRIPRNYEKFDVAVEDYIDKTKEIIGNKVPETKSRWYAIKLLENEEKTVEKLSLNQESMDAIAAMRDQLETRFDDDAESIITAERYNAIAHVIDDCYKRNRKGLTTSQKIDRVVTNRWLGLPIFIVIMCFVYWLAVSIGGGTVTDWANDGVFGDGWLYSGNAAYEEAVEEWEAAGSVGEEPDPSDYGVYIPGLAALATMGLEAIDCAPWLQSLIVDGIISGVGAVLGFVPQMIILFFLLSILELSGYMTRVAFVMDRIFRNFGLSGKSFIPMLIASGCGVPAIMSTKTIENEKDRRMTIMTTTMIPCGAKMPIIALVFGALAGGDSGSTWWVAPLFYFLGVFCIIISGIMLKKTKPFAGEATPFVMELPEYHVPTLKSIWLSTWERVKGYLVKAGTIIFVSTIVIWFLMNFGVYEGSFGLLDADVIGDDYLDYSIMAVLGNLLSWIFIPLGFGNWQATVTSITGLVAKENVVATVGILTQLGDLGESDPLLWEGFAAMLGGGTASIISFCAFNLLCAPCFAAMGTIRKQMNSAKWFWAAIGYMTGFAWVVALMLYQFVGLGTGEVSFNFWTVVAIIFLALILFQLFRPMPHYDTEDEEPAGTAAAAA